MALSAGNLPKSPWRAVEIKLDLFSRRMDNWGARALLDSIRQGLEPVWNGQDPEVQQKVLDKLALHLNRHLKEHVDTLENAVFRSWEALSEEEIQSAIVLVRHEHAKALVWRACGCVNLQLYLDFVDDVMNNAANPALDLFCTNANKFVDKYKDEVNPGPRAQAALWKRDIFRDVGNVEWGWASLSIKRRQIVSDFLTGPRTMARIIEHQNSSHYTPVARLPPSRHAEHPRDGTSAARKETADRDWSVGLPFE
ncbi:hypothetical protein JCM5296_000165 [Sporobolomyces johnsonii]